MGHWKHRVCVALTAATLLAAGCAGAEPGQGETTEIVGGGPGAAVSAWAAGPDEAVAANIVETGVGDLRPIPRISTTREEALGEAGVQLTTTAGTRLPPPQPGALEGEAQEVVLDDFEQGLRWQPIVWENANDCDISLAETGRGRALTLECKGGDEAKAGGFLNLPGGLDLSPYAALSLHVRAGRNVSVASAWLTDTYFESVRKEVESGWEGTLVFSLDSADYKAAPSWVHESALGRRGGAQTVFVLLYYEEPCTVLVDDVRLVPLQ